MDFDIVADPDFQAPLETELGGLEKIFRCSCDIDNDEEVNDGECTADELLVLVS